MESFENIYLDLSKHSGRCRLADSGCAWKPSNGGDVTTIDKNSIGNAQWSRASKGFELKVITRDSAISQFDGFQLEDFERLSKAFKQWYGVNLEHKEHALRGWNWGKGEFGKAELNFSVHNRPAFEIPYTEIANTNLAGKNEVSVEFSLPADGETNGANGTTSGAKKSRRGAARDQLVEARFFIPGTVKKEKKETEDGAEASGDEDDGEGEEQNAANTWYETLMDKAEIGEVAGDTFASFEEILHLTPRGRFDLDMYEKSFRLRGKTYDYKIQYDSIKKFFLLPKTDEIHTLITIGLDPPIRQGQTRYSFLVMQFKRDEDVELDVNITEEDAADKYKDKLEKHYSGPIFMVLTSLFRGLAGKKIIAPSKQFSSRHEQAAVKCSIKANEGFLYCMEKSFMFVPKPATYIAMENISSVILSRVGGVGSASRTFDITFTMKSGQPNHSFSNINREEQEPLEKFFNLKNLKVKNEMIEENAILAAVLKDDDGSDNEVVGADRGSADEDSEEDDEDFQGGSDSDPAEEYDSDAAGSESGSDEEMEDADDAEEAEAGADKSEVVERPKKKAKTGK